ncbi:hypothetical protein GCM10022381_12930 [Leifsonia kafniensis]|uniref:CHAT domain-containing protein n=1 Tax=Leifsonia kafniensis TaxID=475957 RepID=A0ABP7KAU5_9MICO
MDSEATKQGMDDQFVAPEGRTADAAVFDAVRAATASIRDMLDREDGTAELIRTVSELAGLFRGAELDPDGIARVQAFFDEYGTVLADRSPDAWDLLVQALGKATLTLAQHPPELEQRRHWSECAVSFFADAEDSARRAGPEDPLRRAERILLAMVNRSIAETFRADSERELTAAFGRWASVFAGIPRGVGIWEHYRDQIVALLLQSSSLAASRLEIDEGDGARYRLQIWRMAGGEWFESLFHAEGDSPTPGSWADPLIDQEKQAFERALASRLNPLGNGGEETLLAGQWASLYLCGLMMNIGFPPALLVVVFGRAIDAESLTMALDEFGDAVASITGVAADPLREADLARLRGRARIGDERIPGEYRRAARAYLRDAVEMFGRNAAEGAFLAQQFDLIQNAANGGTAADAARDVLEVVQERRDTDEWRNLIVEAAHRIESRASTDDSDQWRDLIGDVRAMLHDALDGAIGDSDIAYSLSDLVRAALAAGKADEALSGMLAAWRDRTTGDEDRRWLAQFLVRMRSVGLAPGVGAMEYRDLVREVHRSVRDSDLALPGMVEILVVLLESSQTQTGLADSDREDLAARTRRAYASSPRRGKVPVELGPLLAPPNGRTLTATLRAIDAVRDELGEEQALAKAIRTLIVFMNSGTVAQEGFAEIHQTVLCLHERHVEHPDERVRRFLTYLVGESARRSGDLATARTWLSKVVDDGAEVRSAGFEADYAALALTQAVDVSDLEDAHFWLGTLQDLTASGTLDAGEMLVNLAIGVVQVASRFGMDEVRPLASDLEDDLLALAENSTGTARAKAELARCEILLVEREDYRAEESFTRLTALLDVAFPRSIEARLRQVRIRSAIASGSYATLREDLERLVHLQDRELLDRTANTAYEDHLGDAPRAIALVAIQQGQVELAIDALERGRLRYLFLLHAEGTGTARPGAPDLLRLHAHEWTEFFVPLSPSVVLERARVRPIVYQFVHGKILTLLGLGRERVNAISLDRGIIGDQVRLNMHLTRFWDELMGQGVAPGTIPVLIDYGLAPQELIAIDRAFAHAHGGPSGIGRPAHLPSARFLVDVAAEMPTGPPPILHLGDGSGTLIGPWLEAAWIRAHYDGPATTLVGEPPGQAAVVRSPGSGATLIASCHGSFSDDGGHFRLGIGRQGVSLSDLFAERWLVGFDNVVLAACDSGASVVGVWERDALSAANAALVAGARSVLAPATPVNDLVSAFVVCGIVEKLPHHDFAMAVELATREVAALTPEEFVRDLHLLWDCLWSSELIERMPWPPSHVESAFWRMAADTVAAQGWRDVPMILLDGRPYSVDRNAV